MAPAEKRQGGKSNGSWFRRVLTSRVFIGIFLTFVLYGVLVAIVVRIPFPPRENKYQIGDKSENTYYAVHDISYLDTIATEDAREKAAAAVPDRYKVDNEVNKRIFDRLGNFFQEVESARRALQAVRDRSGGGGESVDARSEEEVIRETVAKLEVQLTAVSGESSYAGPDLSVWLTMDRGDYWRLRQLMDMTLREELTRQPIRPEELEARRAVFKQYLLDEEDISPEETELLGALGAANIQANALLDVTSTQQAKEAARGAVVPIYGTVSRGEAYLKEGDRITQTHLDIWKALGIITEKGEQERSAMATWMASFLLAIVFLVMVLYMHRFNWDAVASLKTFGLFLLVNGISGITGLLMGLFLFQEGGEAIHVIAVAVILNALLVCQYYSNNIALFNSILWAGVLAAFFGPVIFVPAALCAALTCLIVRRDPSRKMLALLVLLNILVDFFALAALELFAGAEGMEAFSVPNLWIAVIVGAVPVAAVFFLNMLIDLSFNLPTTSRLNEFANLNHPLLRKLQIEAPGTYHHSILVGSIAELAGGEIGANPLMIRVGALYHDIGKGQRPEFFAENQYKGSNIHEKYSPSLSKIIIENHVRDGIRLARRARLPQEIIDMIPEHHGTTLISYFFRKALAMSDGDPVNEHDFRYPGPKPQTAEAAVLMMTDAAESAARALEEPTPHRIETAVNRLFEERLLDGQFNECGLSMDQLEQMKESIVTSLVAAYHHRVSYPDEAEMKREIERGEEKDEGI